MIIDFMTEYWYLFAMLFVILLLLGIDPATRSAGGSKALTPAQVPQLQSQGNPVIVDLNDSDKFAEGHIAQSINIPYANLEASLGKIRKYQKRPVVLVCERGNTARQAVSVLKKNDFTDLYVLAGGLTAWRKDSFPLEKS